MESRLLEVNAGDSAALFKALASETRVQILTLLSGEPMNIHMLGQRLGISQSSVTKNIQMLDQAGLITTEYRQAVQGLQKVCRLRYDRLLVVMEGPGVTDERVEEISMPIGMYTRVHAVPTCGLANRERIIDYLDEPQAFFHPDRSSAQLLWTSEGYVEYTFPNTLPTSLDIYRVDVSMEICSEAPEYNDDHPSDITVWINDVELGSWCSPGDLGGKRGRLNPPWWNEHHTQFGKLKVFSVNREASYVDGTTVSPVTLKQVGIVPKEPIRVRVGVKPDAEHVGGFNLFGRGFGNYEQDIVLRLHYTARKQAGAAPNPPPAPAPDRQSPEDPSGGEDR